MAGRQEREIDAGGGERVGVGRAVGVEEQRQPSVPLRPREGRVRQRFLAGAIDAGVLGDGAAHEPARDQIEAQ